VKVECTEQETSHPSKSADSIKGKTKIEDITKKNTENNKHINEVTKEEDNEREGNLQKNVRFADIDAESQSVESDQLPIDWLDSVGVRLDVSTIKNDNGKTYCVTDANEEYSELVTERLSGTTLKAKSQKNIKKSASCDNIDQSKYSIKGTSNQNSIDVESRSQSHQKPINPSETLQSDIKAVDCKTSDSRRFNIITFALMGLSLFLAVTWYQYANEVKLLKTQIEEIIDPNSWSIICPSVAGSEENIPIFSDIIYDKCLASFWDLSLTNFETYLVKDCSKISLPTKSTSKLPMNEQKNNEAECKHFIEFKNS